MVVFKQLYLPTKVRQHKYKEESFSFQKAPSLKSQDGHKMI